MFIINGEPLQKSTHPDEYEWMLSKFKEIKDTGKKEFIFSAFRKRSMVKSEDGRMIAQKERMRLVSLVGNSTEPNGVSQTWSYAPGMGSLRAEGDGYRLVRQTMALEYTTRFQVKNENDLELIFFFKYLSNNKNIKEIDYKKKSQQEAEATTLRVRAENLIYSPDSPIHPDNIGSEMPMRNLALAWGINNALELDIYSVMKSLWGSILNGESKHGQYKRGFEKFIQEVNKYGDSDRRSVIMMGIKRNVLIYEGNIWKIITKGGSEQFLCGVPAQDEAHKDEYVIKYILENKTIYDLLELSINEPHVPIPVKTEPKMDYRSLKRYELLKLAKEDLGWSGKHYKDIASMKFPELVELLESKKTPEIS